MADLDARAEALEIAEGAREAARTKPSLAAEIFLGRLRGELVVPFPEQDPADRERATKFLEDLERVLRESIDPDEVDRTAEVPAEALRRLHEIGAFRLKVPAAYGGLGMSQSNYNRAAALAGSWCGSTAIWLSGHQSIGVPNPLVLFGTPEQKARFLPRLASGELSGFALTEPEVGSDPARMRMTATPAEGGGWVLDGEKLWCTNGPVASVLVVMARTPDRVVDGRPRKQISAFLVETSSPGIEFPHRCDFMGYRGIQNGLIRFTGVRVPAENLLWREGHGLKLAFVTLNTGRLTLPATNTAAAKQCLAIVRRWASTREQWGDVIGHHEAVAAMVGYIASHTFAMEAFADYTAALADAGQTDIRLEAAMAKLFCSETGWRVADLALQVRGGRGYETTASLAARGETPFPMERLFREARLNTIVEGSSEILRLFLAREALDPHHRRAGALLDPKASGPQKALAAVRLAIRYGAWWVQSFRPGGGTPAALPSRLRGWWRFARRDTRRLARRILYAMAGHRAGLEHRQVLLGRLVDEGVDLTAMAITLSRAASRGDDASMELAEDFCRHTKARILARRRHPAPFDRGTTDVGRAVLEGRYRAVESGILPHVPESGAETRRT